MVRTLLKGEVLKQFETENTKLMQEWETNDRFLKCMNSVALQMLPKQALAKQKLYMCCYMCKPRKVKVHELAASLNEMVGDLRFFPLFRDNQILPTYEVVDIFEAMMPKKWQT